MCLYTRTKKGNIAVTPITVYKVMFAKNYPKAFVDYGKKYDCYFRFQTGGANIGDTVKAKIVKAPVKANTRLHEGQYVVRGEGVHAYKSKIFAQQNDIHNLHFINGRTVITEWEIPAGATYWKGCDLSCGQIAATEMKFKRIILKNV